MQRLKTYILFLAVWLPAFSFGSVSLQPQVADLEWGNVDVDGNRAAVFSILHDSRGLMWLGTSQGLYIYDGAETHQILSKELKGTQVFSIVEKDRNFYLGTNHGLWVYDTEKGSADMPVKQFTSEVRCLLMDGDNLLVGSLNGLYSYSCGTRKLTNMSKGLPSVSVYSLLKDSRGILYAGTVSGLARYNVSSRRFFTVQGFSASFINCIVESTDGSTIYIGTGAGLYTYQPASETWKSVPGFEKEVVKSIFLGRKREMYIGTNNGLYTLSSHYKRDTRKLNSLAGDNIWAIATDAYNNLLIGHERGLSVAACTTISSTVRISSLVPNGESNEFLTVFRSSKGQLFLGGTNGVLIDRGDGNFSWYHLSSGDKATSSVCVRSITEDVEGTVWFSTDGGIYRYDAGNSSFRNFILYDTSQRKASNWVYGMCQIGGNMWVGSYLGGVNAVSLSTLTSNPSPLTSNLSLTGLANDYVSGIASDHRGNLWILLYDCQYLYCYNTRTHSLNHYDIRKLATTDPRKLCVDRQGRVWCAFGGGVIVFSGKGKKVINLPKTSNDEQTFAIAPVDGGVWLSTQHNIWSIDGKTLKPSLVPVQQKGYASIFDDRTHGRVILGGLDEIQIVNKTSLTTARNFGAVRLVINMDGEGADLTNLAGLKDGLEIPYGGNVSLMVSTLNYSPDIIQHFEYKVVKGDDDEEGNWIFLPLGASMINLTDMSFGSYRILIRTVGSPLSPAVVYLTVERPFYLSWYAIVFYCLVVLLIASVAKRLLQWYKRKSDDLKALAANILRLKSLTDVKPIETESLAEKQLARIAQAVEDNIADEDLTVTALGEMCGMPQKQLYRLIKKHMGVSPLDYMRNVRLEKAAKLLSQHKFTVSEVSYKVGFGTPSYFSKCFQAKYGCKPSEYIG